MLFHRATVQTVEIDLIETPYQQWPEEAKDAARLLFQRRPSRYKNDLMPKVLLAHDVEAWLSTAADDLF